MTEYIDIIKIIIEQLIFSNYFLIIFYLNIEIKNIPRKTTRF